MNHEDKKAFARLLTDALAFYGKDVTLFSLDVWWEACQPFEFSLVRRAFTRHAMDAERGQFAPKPADLVRQLSGTSSERAALAWGRAIDEAARIGAYTDVAFDDPAIHATIEDLGGWPKFCRGEVKDLSYLQHRFCESYKAYAGRGEFDFPRVLHGDRSPDEMYLRRGLPAPRPVLIGDPVKAKLVMQGGRAGGRGGAIAMDAVLERLPLAVAVGRKEAA